MKKKLSLLLFFGLIFGLSVQTLVFADTVKIGLLTTLSGGGSSLGTDVRDGFQLAIEQAKPGNVKIELLVEDDGRKPAKAKKISDKFIKKDKVQIMTGIIFSNLALAVVPAATKAGVFYISPNAGPSLLAGKKCHENYFNVAWQNDNLHEAMGKYVTDNKYKDAFILAPNYPAGKDALTGFKRFYKGKISGEVYTKLGQKDYASELAKIRASNASSVFFFLPGGMGISFVKQYSQSGLKAPLFGAAFSFDQTMLKAIGDSALGTKNTSQWSKDLDVPANKAFVAAFLKKYNRLPSLYASQGYDAAQLIISALKVADVNNKDAFRKALHNANFDSVRGDFKFGNNRHPIQDIYVREVVKENGVLTNKIIGKGLENHKDVYAADCKN